MSKLDKSLKNAKVAFVFYFITLVVSFVSRRVFIDVLGTELVGLSAIMQNILGFLNLAELGVYTAVLYALYKPLVNKDEAEINKIISLFGYLYRIVGFVIMGLGIVVSFFLPLFFEKANLHWTMLLGSYYTFLSITLFSYFNNFRQILLRADQRGYTVARINNYLAILKVILQIVCLKYLSSSLAEAYFIWLGFELIFSLIIRWRTNWVVKRDYPWLQPNLKNGRQLLKEYPQIVKHIKDLFAHKIGEFALFQTTQILIFAFTSLTVVALYGNYILIVNKLSKLITSTLGSNVAGVGQVIAKGDKQKNYKLFTEFNALFFFIGGVFVYCLYYLAEPFIALWLGEEFILSRTAFILILVSAYILLIRRPIDFFILGFGLHRDVWAAWTMGIINLLVAIVAGYYWGLEGVLFGSVVSIITILLVWKSYFLFRNGLDMSVFKYWKNVVIYVGLLILSYIIVLPLHNYLPDINSFLTWALNAAVITSAFVVVYGGCMYLLAPGLKGVFARLLNKWKKK